jgi:ankyrin repeat protein
MKGHVQVVKELREHGADIEAKTHYGSTPLHCACCFGRVAVAIELLGHGDEFHANKDSNGATTGKRKSRGGVDINAKDSKDDTPLHWASMSNHCIVVKVLLSGGANILAPNKIGQLPIHMAVSKGNSAVSKSLLEAFYTTSRPLPLHELVEDLTWIPNPDMFVALPALLAALRQNVLGTDDVVEILDSLVENNPEWLLTRNQDGSLPLHVACHRGVALLSKLFSSWRIATQPPSRV